MGFVRIIVIFNVTLEVSSPRISLTDINVLSVILSSGSGFQFLIMIAPRDYEKRKKLIRLTQLMFHPLNKPLAVLEISEE